MGGMVGVEWRRRHDLHGDAGRRLDVDDLEVDPWSAPSACSWSFDQCGLGAPDTYQFDPLSARIIP
jgi:hypothetical protein